MTEPHLSLLPHWLASLWLTDSWSTRTSDRLRWAGAIRSISFLRDRSRQRTIRPGRLSATALAIPVYNEEAVVPELIRRATAVLEGLPGGPHEIVLVDDGSSDRTLEFLERAAEKDERIVVVALSRNFGHQTALAAALDLVSGDVAVLLD